MPGQAKILSHHISIIVIIFLLAVWTQAAHAADPLVTKAFAEADKYARHQKTFPNGPCKEGDQQCAENIKQITNMIAGLRARQLVELIRLCKKQIHDTPQDSKHEPYFGYFESIIKFSIRRLGDMKTSDAKSALSDVYQVIRGAESLTLVWDEAKEKQSKSAR